MKTKRAWDAKFQEKSTAYLNECLNEEGLNLDDFECRRDAYTELEARGWILDWDDDDCWDDEEKPGWRETGEIPDPDEDPEGFADWATETGYWEDPWSESGMRVADFVDLQIRF